MQRPSQHIFINCYIGVRNNFRTNSPVTIRRKGGGGGGSRGCAKRVMCPYQLKVQARPPRDQRLVTQPRVSGRERREGPVVIFKTVEKHEWSI